MGFKKKKFNMGKLNLFPDDQYRNIRNNILLCMKESGKSLIVTSPSLIEQKSIITTKIALAFAEQGKSILLVDMNVKKPTLHQLFLLDNNYGLTSLLLDKDLESSPICKTMYYDLHVLAAGPQESLLCNSFMSDKFVRLQSEWEDSYDYIIFEMPPFIETTDTQILTEKGDGVLLVLQEGVTKKKETLEIIKMLGYGRKKFIGAIYFS